jgi:hypothetical protein
VSALEDFYRYIMSSAGTAAVTTSEPVEIRLSRYCRYVASTLVRSDSMGVEEGSEITVPISELRVVRLRCAKYRKELEELRRRLEAVDTCPTCNGTGRVKHTCKPIRISGIYEYSYGSEWIEQCPTCSEYYHVDSQVDCATGSSLEYTEITVEDKEKWVLANTRFCREGTVPASDLLVEERRRTKIRELKSKYRDSLHSTEEFSEDRRKSDGG